MPTCQSDIIKSPIDITEGRQVMRCPKCGSEMPVAANFCSSCGSALQSVNEPAPSVTKFVTCPECRGARSFLEDCILCNGTGEERCDYCDGDGWTVASWNDSSHVTCRRCQGSGSRRCTSCAGRGTQTNYCYLCAGKGKLTQSELAEYNRKQFELEQERLRAIERQRQAEEEARRQAEQQRLQTEEAQRIQEQQNQERLERERLQEEEQRRFAEQKRRERAMRRSAAIAATERALKNTFGNNWLVTIGGLVGALLAFIVIILLMKRGAEYISYIQAKHEANLPSIPDTLRVSASISKNKFIVLNDRNKWVLFSLGDNVKKCTNNNIKLKYSANQDMPGYQVYELSTYNETLVIIKNGKIVGVVGRTGYPDLSRIQSFNGKEIISRLGHTE